MSLPKLRIAGGTTPNQELAPEELRKIRALEDFDLTMLVSEIHDHGWPVARRTLALMPEKGGAHGAS